MIRSSLKTFLAIILLISPHLFATEFVFSRLSESDGLSHGVVRSVTQDQRGFLWVGTEDGLNRFDGFTYRQFKFMRGEKRAGDVVADMVMVDNDLWIGLDNGGLIRLNTLTEDYSFVADDIFINQNIERLFVDASGNVWVGTAQSSIIKLDVTIDGGVEVESLQQSVGTSPRKVTAIAQDELGRMWFGTDGNGIDIYHPGTKKWLRVEHQETHSQSLSSNRVSYILKDKSGDMWIGTIDGGLNHYHMATRKITRHQHNPQNTFSLVDDHVITIMQAESGAIWIGTDKGLSLYEDGRFESIKHDSSSVHSLSNNRVLSLHQDRANLIWVGTLNGLNRYDPSTKQFNHTIPRISPEYNHAVITGFAQLSDGTQLISTYGGGIVKQPSGSENWEMYGAKDGLPDERVMSIFVDRKDGIWAGTRSKGLIYKAKDSKDWENYVSDGTANALPSNGVTDVIQDSNGEIWVSTYQGGLSRKGNSGFLNIPVTDSTGGGLSNKNVIQMFEGSDGLLYLATDGGLNIVSPSDLSVEQISTANGFELSSDTLTYVHEDRKGNIWLATYGTGINLWRYQDRNTRTNNFQVISTAQGMASNVVYGIAEGDDGNIWASTGKGLSKIDSDTLAITNYNVSQGLQGNDFNVGAVFKDASGVMYFGGINGYNHFSAKELNFDSPIPPVELLSVYAINEKQDIPIDGSPITFYHNDYLVSFDYVALDFAAPEKNQYQYRLMGFDQEWVEVGNLRRATYTNLPAGDYQFQVRAANLDGQFSEPQINLAISKAPAPWQTVWAYSLYVLALSMAVFLFLRQQMRKLAREEKQRKELEIQVKARTQELKEQNKKLKSLNTQLKRAHSEDALTGAFNRHFLDEFLKQQLPLLCPEQGDTNNVMPVLLIDMDNLKPINDTYGHAAGDAAIVHMAQTLEKALGDDFYLIRWGGDEFMVVGIANDVGQSLSFLKDVKNTVAAESFKYFDHDIDLTCSMGLSFYPFDQSAPQAMSWDQVSMLADKALFLAKKQPGISWCAVTKPKREINDLYISELIHCQNISEVSDLIEIEKS